MKPTDDIHNFEDIINLPHHVSSERGRMSRLDRAAQFAPFAALTGYDDEIKETARLTSERPELDEDRAAAIDTSLQILKDNAEERPEITVTYFSPDDKKDGGAYVTYSGSFRRIDESDRSIVFTDGKKIAVEDIYAVEGDVVRLSYGRGLLYEEF